MSIIKIAVLDDLQNDRLILSEKINAYLGERKVPFELKEFECAEDFLRQFKPKSYDLVFLDIYMDGMNGIDAAREIYRQDYNCKLIFLTVANQFWKESFAVRAVYYLTKPLIEEDFNQAMELADIRAEYTVPIISVLHNKAPRNIDTGKIMYIEYVARKPVLHLTDETLALNMSFAEATEPLMSDGRFLMCYRGVLVNMEYVDRVMEDCFLLQNGDKLPINIRNKKMIVAAYRNYHMGSIRRRGL